MCVCSYACGWTRAFVCLRACGVRACARVSLGRWVGVRCEVRVCGVHPGSTCWCECGSVYVCVNVFVFVCVCVCEAVCVYA